MADNRMFSAIVCHVAAAVWLKLKQINIFASLSFEIKTAQPHPVQKKVI
jgi:hypothetical protein